MDPDQLIDEVEKAGPAAKDALERVLVALRDGQDATDAEKALRSQLLDAKLRSCGLSDKDRRFAMAYVDTLSLTSASASVDTRPQQGLKRLRKPRVAEAVSHLMEDREAKSELTGDYVRKYLLDVLELCPAKYFWIDHDGGWAITQEALRELPHEVQRLIDSVEQRRVFNQSEDRWESYLVVKFVSKISALRMAVLCTQVAKGVVAHVQIPWDKIAKMADASDANYDKLLDKLNAGLADAAAARQGQQGHAEADRLPVAVGDPVRQTA